jgi:hypothetical protein
MTDEQINAAIAEVCGRAHTNIEPYAYPNYCTDLNAMHEAQNTLTGGSRSKYVYELWDVTEAKTLGAFENINATARQRAEAFLRTLGKWEERK